MHAYWKNVPVVTFLQTIVFLLGNTFKVKCPVVGTESLLMNGNLTTVYYSDCCMYHSSLEIKCPKSGAKSSIALYCV